MTRTMKHWRTAALFFALALAFFIPSVAFAADPPVATLYSPANASTNAAATDHQKIIFSLSEAVTLASDKNITISGGGADYIAAASSGTLIGNQSWGNWYVVYDLGDFLNGGTPLTLSAGVAYSVTAAEGAFVSGGLGSAQVDASFTTVSGGVAVIFTKTNDSQSVSAGGSPITSGQAVASGSALSYSLDDVSYTLARTIRIGGAITAPAALPSTVPASDLELYFFRSEGTLTGDAAVSGNPYYNEPLSGSVSGSNQTDTGKLFFRWVRETTSGDTELTSGPYGTSYTLKEADIGSVIRLDVTSGENDGVISADSATITKAPFSGSVKVPELESRTDTSITLKTVSGYEYRLDAGPWQSNTTFGSLAVGSSHDFYQRAAETSTTFASDSSLKTTISTKAALSGTVSFNTAAQSGVALTGSISGTNNASGTLTYTWQKGGSDFASGATYTPSAADIGSTLTLVISTSDQTGTISGTTSAVLKANAAAPAAPTMASSTATSITLNTVSGYQYSLGGTYWQDTTSFYNLVAGSTYTFYQRVAETSATLVSPASPGANLSTTPALTGTVLSSGEARYGITLVVNLSGSNNTGTLTYTWKRGTVAVGYGTSYAVQAADISNQLSVEVTSSVQGGSVTRSFGTVQKAYYVGSTPAAPTRHSRTTSKIVLSTVDGCEYSRGGTTWQDSTTFSGLSSGTSYTFYQRIKATATTEASPTSAAYKTSTSTESDSSDDTTTTPKPTPTTSSGTDNTSGTTLYTYALTDDNTRILYSTMKSLAAGNKTQDVTIKQSNVEFTFPKGTMTDTYTQLWYDFGTTINNSIAEQTAKQIAGDAYVATIHFNYSGELPGKANIRIWLGAAQAGKTLYYYRLEDNNSLTFMQTATVDTTGWVTISQESCSDYVFLDRDIASVNASSTPTPSADAAATPLPSPTATADNTLAGFASDGWFIAAIILIAIALIVGGIWLYTKNKDEY